MPTVPVMEGNEREDNLPRLPTPRQAALKIARQKMQAIRVIGRLDGKPKYNGLKCNIKRLFFGQIEMGYLGYLVTRTVIRTMNKKVEATVNRNPPKNTKYFRALIGISN